MDDHFLAIFYDSRLLLRLVFAHLSIVANLWKKCYLFQLHGIFHPGFIILVEVICLEAFSTEAAVDLSSLDGASASIALLLLILVSYLQTHDTLFLFNIYFAADNCVLNLLQRHLGGDFALGGLLH